MCVCVCVCFVAQSCLTLCDPMDCSPLGSSVHVDSPGKNTGVGCHPLLQGILPALGLNPHLSHCRQILYCLSHQGSPRILEWVACLFSRGSFQPRNWTGVSCIAGGLFTSWVVHIYSFFRLLYIIGYCKILNNVPSASIFISNIGHNFLGNFYCQLLLAKIIGNNFLFSVWYLCLVLVSGWRQHHRMSLEVYLHLQLWGTVSEV